MCIRDRFATEQIKIITKDANDGFVPFSFNKCQQIITEKLSEQLKETGKVRAIILKARQQGISTYCAGRVFWKSYFTPYARPVVMAHDSATSDALFGMSKNLINYLPSAYRPDRTKSNAREIVISPGHFPKDLNDERASASYRLYTAGSPEAGRGTTPTIAHLSEVAFWGHDVKILAGLFQGISQAEGTEVIIESTANGAQGEFYRLWKGAVAGDNEYLPIFLPWFITPEYTLIPPDDMELTVEEDGLVEKFGLTNGQLYWRRLKIAESGEAKFRQEYPATPEEAFIASGSNVFDIEKIDQWIPEKPEVIREYSEATNYFEDMKGGSLSVYRFPKFDELFVIGADVSQGIGKDYQCAVVMDTSHNVVALYRNNELDPTMFGDILYYLGRMYNNALLAVESNSVGIATLTRLTQMQYVNLYYQTKTANLSKEEGTRPGFKTTGVTKPAIIGHLQNAIKNDDVFVPSTIMIQELKDYIADDNGKMSAVEGAHDDTVIALAIAMEVMRTHADRLSTTRVSWKDRTSSMRVLNQEEWL